MRGKTDIRVLKSKRDLRNGLFELLKTKTFDKITVIEICEVAEINKMTFYKHYNDKYDLFEDCVKSQAEKLYKSTLETLKLSSPIKEDLPAFCAMAFSTFVEVCFQYRNSIIALSSSDSATDAMLLQKGISIVNEEVFAQLGKHLQLRYPEKYVASFITGGMVSAITSIIRDFEHVNKDDMYKSFKSLFEDLINGNTIFVK